MPIAMAIAKCAYATLPWKFGGINVDLRGEDIAVP
jgi:hypothetical protein